MIVDKIPALVGITCGNCLRWSESGRKQVIGKIPAFSATPSLRCRLALPPLPLCTTCTKLRPWTYGRLSLPSVAVSLHYRPLMAAVSLCCRCHCAPYVPNSALGPTLDSLLSPCGLKRWSLTARGFDFETGRSSSSSSSGNQSSNTDSSSPVSQVPYRCVSVLLGLKGHVFSLTLTSDQMLYSGLDYGELCTSAKSTIVSSQFGSRKGSVKAMVVVGNKVFTARQFLEAPRTPHSPLLPVDHRNPFQRLRCHHVHIPGHIQNLRIWTYCNLPGVKIPQQTLPCLGVGVGDRCG